MWDTLARADTLLSLMLGLVAGWGFAAARARQTANSLRGLVSRLRRQLDEVELEFRVTPPAPAEALVVMTSIYSPRRRDIDRAAVEQTITRLKETALDDLSLEDFAAINVKHSNLAIPLAAIEYHYDKRLRDLAIISTENEADTGIMGSEDAGVILKRFLCKRYGLAEERTLDNRFNIRNLTIKSFNYKQLQEAAETLFDNYSADSVVADITSGTAMMTVAMSMAFASKGRKLQYMASTRSWDGEPLPEGELIPVGIELTATQPGQM